MVIEWLKFKVSALMRETFIEKDAQIWTVALAKYPGFLGKEIWINPNISDEIVLIIHWENRQQWEAIPRTVLEEIERRFAQAMGEDTYQLIEFGEYHVRKFPNL